MEILRKESCKVRNSKCKDWEEERNHQEGALVDHVGLLALSRLRL